VYPDLQILGAVASPLTGFAIQVNERTKLADLAADDRDHEG
jgi:hypothetical protein